jgi:hypothetical protein
MFFALDVAVAIALPLVLWWLHRRGATPPVIWPLFWLGVAIGLTWELGYHFTGPLYSQDPSYVQAAEYPGHPLLQPFMHALWDGGLFLVGLALVWRLCPAPRLARFSWRELAVLVAWGQAQELCVELAATAGGAWSFTPRWWNPVLFEFGEGSITLAPQLIWLAAPIAFYLFALRVQRRTVSGAA